MYHLNCTEYDAIIHIYICYDKLFKLTLLLHANVWFYEKYDYILNTFPEIPILYTQFKSRSSSTACVTRTNTPLSNVVRLRFSGIVDIGIRLPYRMTACVVFSSSLCVHRHTYRFRWMFSGIANCVSNNHVFETNFCVQLFSHTIAEKQHTQGIKRTQPYPPFAGHGPHSVYLHI